MKQIPIPNIDSHADILVLTGPKNYLTIGPIFQSIRSLQVIKITHSNVPSRIYNPLVGLFTIFTNDQIIERVSINWVSAEEVKLVQLRGSRRRKNEECDFNVSWFFLSFSPWIDGLGFFFFSTTTDEDRRHHVKQPLSEMSTLFIADGTLISNNEISFKFPIDDHPICTIDEYIIPPTQPTIGKYIPSSG